MKLAELKKKIGAEISFHKKSSGFLYGESRRFGILRDVQGKNLLIDSDYFWYPDLCEIVVEKEPDPPVRKTRKKPA